MLANVTDTRDIVTLGQNWNFYNANDQIMDKDNYFVNSSSDINGTIMEGLNYSSPPKVNLTEDMIFGTSHVVGIVAYSVLMVISAVGNLTVLFTLHQKQRHRRSRVNLLLMHLAVADLLVTFLMMPLEVGWSATVYWWADDASCRIMSFFRIFGLYLSSFILVCISLDRYYAVIHPLSVRDADRRTKIMLQVAWIAAVMCGAPQIAVFSRQTNPYFPWYSQCLSIFFNNESLFYYYLAYNIFCMTATYGFPLIVIVATYGAILFEIRKKSQECNGPTENGHREISLRRSGPETLTRAHSKTLRMTIIMVAVFILCWTPYYCLCFWYWFDYESAKHLNLIIQKSLFIFASSNSCMNPLVYGFFMVQCACFGRRTQETFDELLEKVASIGHRKRAMDSEKETGDVISEVLIDIPTFGVGLLNT